MPVAVNEYSAQKGGAEVVPGGMETWGGRRSAAYASMCGPLLPFLREGRPGAGFGEFSKGRVQLVRILTKSTLVLVTEVLRLVLPIRSHPINPIRSSPAGGGGPGFSRDGRHTSGHGSESGRAVRAVRGRCGRLRATYTRLRDALSGSTGNGFVSGALLPLVASRAVCVGRIYSGLWRNYG